MRICFIVTAVFALTSAASAAEPGRVTAILVSPIHEAQVVRGDDGMDHVEFTRAGAVFAPLPQFCSACIVLNDARVAVAVSDKDMTIPRKGNSPRPCLILCTPSRGWPGWE